MTVTVFPVYLLVACLLLTYEASLSLIFHLFLVEQIQRYLTSCLLSKDDFNLRALYFILKLIYVSGSLLFM